MSEGASGRRFRWRALVAAAAVALLAGSCADGVTGSASDPTPAPDEADPAAGDQAGDGGTAAAAPAVEPQVVQFAAADGEMLEGSFYDGGGAIGMVLAHMRGRDRRTWREFAEVASARGYRVLAFDFRGYGGSTGQRDTGLDIDLFAAVEFIRSQGIIGTVVVGASMGATAAVNVAAQTDLAAVVSLSAPGDFGGLPAARVADEVVEPMLVVAAEDDLPYADDAAAIAKAAPSARLELLEGNAHGTNLFGDHGAQLTELILRFVARRVG